MPLLSTFLTIITILYHIQKALNASYSHQDLADWTRDTYKLSYTPSRSTIPQPPSREKLLPTQRNWTGYLQNGSTANQAGESLVNGHLIKQQGQILQSRLNTR